MAEHNLNRLKTQLSATDQFGQSEPGIICSQGSKGTGPNPSLVESHRLSFTNPTTPPLTRRNLKEHDEKQQHHMFGRDTDSLHQQRQSVDLQNTLSDLGLESSNDLIARMLPASSGETPMTSFLSEKNDLTMQEMVYNGKFSTKEQMQNMDGEKSSLESGRKHA